MEICEDFHGSTHELCGEKWRALYQPSTKEIAALLYVQNVMSLLAVAEFQTVDIGVCFCWVFLFPLDILY
jgi:hypothetical protein